MKPAADSLASIGISINDLEGNVKPVNTILGELSEKWNGLSDAQRQNMGVTLAGRNQLSRFLALMNNYNIAVDATDTALNSQGSAMKEQEKYANSLEGRIATLKNTWTEFSIAMGEAVLSDGLMSGIDAIKSFGAGVIWLVKHVGALPLAIGGITTALMLMNKGLRGSAVSMLLFRTSLTEMAVSAVAAKVALRALLSSTLIGAAFALLGLGIEKLVGMFTKAREESKKLEKQLNTSADGYSKNTTKVDELTKRLEELETQKKKSGLTPNEEKEYLKIQQQLVNILPSVKQGENAKGQALVQNSKQLKKDIGLIKEKIRLERDEAIVKADKTLSNSDDKFSGLNKDKSRIKKELDDMYNQKNKYTVQYGNEDNYNKAILKKRQELLEVDQKINKEKLKLNNTLNAVLKTDTALSSSDTEWLNNQFKSGKQNAEQIADMADQINKVRELSGDMFSAKDAGNLSEGQLKILKTISKDAEDGSVKMSKYKDELAKVSKGSSFADVVMAKFNTTHKQAALTIDDIVKSFSSENDQIKDMSDVIKSLEGDLTGLLDVAAKSATAGDLETSKAILQKQAYEAASDSVSVYNGLLEDLSNGKRITAAEAMNLIGKEQELGSAISIENGQVKVNTDAVLKMRDAKIRSYEDGSKAVITAALNVAKATVNNLKNYGLEIKAIQSVEDAKKRVADIGQAIGETSGMGDMGAREEMDKAYSAAKNVSDLADSIDEMTNMASTGLSQVGTSFEDASKSTDGYTGATEKAGDATDDATDSTNELSEATDDYTFVLDKYKRQLEEIELLLTKQNSITSKYPEHSAKYRASLQEEIKILEQKAAAIEAQNSSLQTQIDEGYIQPTGIVNNGASGLAIGGSGSATGGGYTGKYASIINQAAAKYGVNPNLIAGIIKQESQFNPNARSGAGAKGLMQLMPATSKDMGVSNPYDPVQNIMGGTKYIAQMLKKYNGNIETALRAYNAGAGNVANGKAYRFAETNNYVKRVTANLAAYGGGGAYTKGTSSGSSSGSGGASVSNGSASAANYYLNNFRISTPFAPNGINDGVHGAKGHKGIDLAGKTSGGAMGKPIYSLTSGKVTQIFKNNPTAGNGVVILGDDGRTYRYIHMQKTPPVKTGQKITAGQQIGNIGSTGFSTGAHLDLKVVENGKYIDPQKVLKQMAAGGGGGSSSGSSYNASQVAAQNASDVADAQSQILSNKSSLIQIADEIEQKRVDAEVNSFIKEFDVKKDDIDSEISKSKARNERNTEDSKAYRAELEKQMKLLNDKKKIEKDQDAFLSKKYKGNYSDAVKFDIKTKQKELGVQREETLNQIREIQGAILDSSLIAYDKAIEKYTDKLSKLDAQLNRTTQGTSAYAKVLGDKTKATNDIIKANADEVKFLEQALKSYDLMPDVVENYKDKIKELNDQSEELKDNLKEINKAVIDNELYKYDKKRENNYDTSAKEAELKRTTLGTEAYRKILDDQSALLKGSKSNTDAEITYLEKALKTYQLMPDAIEEYTKRLKELKAESLSIKDSIQQTNKAIIDDVMYRYEKQRSSYDFKNSLIGSENQRVEEGSSEWFYKQKKQIDYMRKESESIKIQKEELERRLKSTDLNAQDKADYYKQLNDLAVQYSDSLNDVYNAEKALSDKREQVANNAIDAMKEYYTQQRELSRKAADEQIKDINKVYDAKKRSLSDEISDKQYKKDYDNLTKQRQDLQRQMNLLLTDTSAEGAVKRSDLKKQIEEIDTQISDLIENRTNEKRQQNLDDEQQKKLDEIDKQQEAADKAFDELMNNERNWENLKKQIENGDYEAVNQEMKRMQSDVLKNFSDLGEAIQTNLVDKLGEAIKMMPQIGWSKETGEVNAPKVKTLGKEDMYYLAGKLLTDEVAGNLKGADATAIKDMGSKMSTAARNTKKLNLDKDNLGSTYDELALDMSSDQKLTLAKYIELNILSKLKGDQKTQVQKVLKSITDEASKTSKVVSVDDSYSDAMYKIRAAALTQTSLANSTSKLSLTGDNLSSALTDSEQSNVFSFMSSLKDLASKLPDLAKIDFGSTVPSSTTDNKNYFNITIDKLMGGKEGAKTLFDEINKMFELRGAL
ncbi:transglycosylase SLT domain-containing protein [Priestia sp. SB1]|uniref:transglycosylase SLT domain-containing protein n=1 Tax=Priestia sp. SB1 TaxID=3132359 RepID=UPI003179B041